MNRVYGLINKFTDLLIHQTPKTYLKFLVTRSYHRFDSMKLFEVNSRVYFVILLALIFETEFVAFKLWKFTNFRQSNALFASVTAMNDFHVGIVGGGPSGLLLAHRFLKQGRKVTVFESRSDPRTNLKEGRAYALGIGMRGRTAIRSVDNLLWDSVKARGFESERFIVYIGGFRLKLRDGDGGMKGAEPSVLMYQTDLCAALLDELELRHSKDKLSLLFNTKITDCDINQGSLVTSLDSNKVTFDLIVGCDGVNSVVRESIAASFPSFQQSKTVLPGEFKVCRLDENIPKIDPSAVCLVLPKSGSTGAFVEPTAYGPCVLFSSRNKEDPILYPTSINETASILEKSFPLLQGADFISMAEQLYKQKPGTASTVVCNTYHYSDKIALVGDSAHATGGVSGQGVNSALCDAKQLADCFDETNDKKVVLLNYSKRQVPEGLALYDLSFGPTPKGLLGIKYKLKGILDSIFRGRFGIGSLPLQNLLTTTLIPFAEIRRQKDKYYDTNFPTQDEFNSKIDSLSL